MTDLPSSGDPGVAPPADGSLPRPPLWPQAADAVPFHGMAEDTAEPPSPARRRAAFAAVGVMIVGLALVGLAVVVRSWLLLAVGVVVGAAGAVVALRVRIMEDVSVSDSPGGPA